MKKRKIYIAGPMTGLPGYNYAKFNAWAEHFRLCGWDVANPAEIGAKFGTADEINADKRLLEAVMAAEIEELATCDAVFLLNGWQRSRGSRKELEAALSRDLEIILQPVLV
jgi:hypothetical protein